MKYLLLSIVLIFSACSFQQPANEWQFKSVNAFESYTKNFLSYHDNLAKSDLQRATQHAKSSADLTQLSRIYLGECALNISVGIQDNCKKYLNISELVQNKELDAYQSFLTSSLSKEQIQLLPNTYQSFALHVKNTNFSSANQDILNMTKASSKFLSSALIVNNITNTTLEDIIKTASYYGYKKVVIFWLHEKKKRTHKQKEKEKIDKKISILLSLFS